MVDWWSVIITVIVTNPISIFTTHKCDRKVQKAHYRCQIERYLNLYSDNYGSSINTIITKLEERHLELEKILHDLYEFLKWNNPELTFLSDEINEYSVYMLKYILNAAYMKVGGSKHKTLGDYYAER